MLVVNRCVYSITSEQHPGALQDNLIIANRGEIVLKFAQSIGAAPQIFIIIQELVWVCGREVIGVL